MVVNKNHKYLRKLTAKQRKTIQKEFFRLFRRSLFTTVAERLQKECPGVHKYDRTYVHHTWTGQYKAPSPDVERILWEEVSRLICKEGETGDCPQCPLRKACERMAEEDK